MAAALLLDLLLREFVIEFSYESFKEQEISRLPCSLCGQHCRKFGKSIYMIDDEIVKKAGHDVYGQKVDNHDCNGELVECGLCKKSVAAARFAPHLEKCMGLGRSARIKRNTGSKATKTSTANPPSSASELEEFAAGTTLDNDGLPLILPDDPYKSTLDLLILITLTESKKKKTTKVTPNSAVSLIEGDFDQGSGGLLDDLLMTPDLQ